MDKKELEKQKGCPARQETEERFISTKQKEITIFKDILTKNECELYAKKLKL
jgi:hypothetical protein